MNQQIQKWRESGGHLPDFLKDFHDQKDVFKLMHNMLGEQDAKDSIRRPDWVQGHVYVIDCFLWFMARHGYTLQKSRKNIEFESIEENIEKFNRQMRNSFAAMIQGSNK